MNPNKDKGSGTSHWAILGYIRFILAFIVECVHLSNEVYNPIGFITRFGNFAAVGSFFMISGFSINHSISLKPKYYYLRRFMRIVPTYWAVLCISVIVASKTYFYYRSKGDQIPSPKEIIAHVLFLQQVVTLTMDINLPMWSLALEEAYYWAAPQFKKLQEEYIWMLIVVSATFFLLLPEIIMIIKPGGSVLQIIYGVGHISFLWLWLVGWLIYQAVNKHRLYYGLLIALPASLGKAYYMQDGADLGVFTITGVILLLLARDEINSIGAIKSKNGDDSAAMLKERVAKIINNKTFQKIGCWLGDMSYEIYIVHYPVIKVVKIYSLHAKVGICTYFLSIFLVAIVILYCVDRPCRSLFEKYYQNKTVS